MPPFWRRSTNSSGDALVARLSKLTLFHDLEPRALEALAGELEWIALPGGTVLFEQGEPSDALYLMLYGRLLAERRDARGLRHAVGSIGAGETVGESGLLAGVPRNARVTAVRDCELLRLSEAGYERVTARFPQPMLRLARFALRRYAESRDRPALPSCLALLPAMPGVDVEGFARRLLGQLGVDDVDTALIDAEDGAGRDHAWFAERESMVSRTLYLGGDEAGWRERCVRQSDTVLLLADAARAPDQTHRIPLPPLHDAVDATLILLQKGDPAPGSTRAWLDAFPQASRHVHVRGDADLARLARRLTGRDTGFVLSGGGARGFAHLGALRALREAGHVVDHVGGTSIGAIVGAGIAADWDEAQLLETYRRAFVDGRPVRQWTLPLMSLYSGRSVSDLLREAFGERDIEDLPLPFYAVSSNLTHGRLEVHEHGPLWLWLRATAAIPGILPPVFSDGRVLVDGGVLDNLPVREMRQRTHGRIVALDAGGDYALQTTLEEAEAPSWWRLAAELFGLAPRRHPNILQILIRAGMVNSEATTRRWRHYADLFIRPGLPDVDLLDWSAFERAIEAGYRATAEALESDQDTPSKAQAH